MASDLLHDPVLEGRLFKLSACAGLSVNEILVADASRYSNSLNAYVTGIGSSARIVLYDTLLKKSSPQEIAIVLAHEIGHRVRAHIRKGLMLGILGLLIGLTIADRVLNRCVRQGFRGIDSRKDPALVVPGYTLYVVLMFVALVPSNFISRVMEAEADRSALELTRDPDTFIHSNIRIARSNLSQVLPPPEVEFALFTHPSIAHRIWMAQNFRSQQKPQQDLETGHQAVGSSTVVDCGIQSGDKIE